MVEETEAKALVERFYYSGWNKNSESVVMECIDPNVRYKPAMGRRQGGAKSVIQYMTTMHKKLGRHIVHIEDMIVNENKVAARIKCNGIHRADFFGVPGTGHEIAWNIAAFFTIRDGKIVELWTLGDVDAVKRQIGAKQDTPFFPVVSNAPQKP